MRVLIFLKNIRELQWKDEDSESGTIRRSSRSRPAGSTREVEVSESFGKQSDAEQWLVFRRPVSVSVKVKHDPQGYCRRGGRIQTNPRGR